MDKIIETYDTTLRFATFEGSEGIKLEERLAIIRMLDSMGITYIDIGTPENSEEYDRFLKQALELQLESAVLTPFIRAKDCGRRIGMEPAVLKILEMDAQTVCVEGECSEYVIRDEGKMRLEENLWQISQVISCVLVLWCLFTTDSCYRLQISKLGIKGEYLLQIFQVGVPAGIQSVVINFSNVLLQSSVNSFGSIAMAGYTAANNIFGFLFVSVNSITQACMSFTVRTTVPGRKNVWTGY